MLQLSKLQSLVTQIQNFVCDPRLNHFFFPASQEPLQAVFERLYIAVKDTEGIKLSTYLSLEYFRYFQVFRFLQVKSDAKALRIALSFKFQLHDYKREVMIGANVDVWKTILSLLCQCWTLSFEIQR